MRRPRAIILSMRRSGGRGVQKLLGEVSPADSDMGDDPFLWSRPLGEISRLFHEGQPVESLRLLSRALARGLCFKHSFDLSTADFNRMLMCELNRQNYHLIYVEREDEAARLFSLYVASKYDVWTRLEMASLRVQMKQSPPNEVTNQAAITQMIQAQQARFAELRSMLSESTMPILRIGFETFFRSGAGVIPVADELFNFAGLGSRGASLSDETLLQTVWGGEHYSEALCAFSPGLLTARNFIASHLARANRHGR